MDCIERHFSCPCSQATNSAQGTTAFTAMVNNCLSGNWRLRICSSRIASGPLDDHPEWFTCASASECTSVRLGCYYWQPINKNFSSSVGSSSCTKSRPAGPQPTGSCVNHQCVNDPFTVKNWSELEPYQKFELVMSRVEACGQASGGFSNDGYSISRTQRYEAVLDEQIRHLQRLR